MNAEAQKNYRERVGNFIVKMIDKPIRVHDDYTEQGSFKITARGARESAETDMPDIAVGANTLAEGSWFERRSQSFNPHESI